MREGVDVTSLGWGWMHSGIAVLPFRPDSALDWFGWTSPELDNRSEKKLAQLEARALPLSETSPRLRFGRCYRGKQYAETYTPRGLAAAVSATRAYLGEGAAALLNR